jgi:hypothetical protein
MHAYVPLAQDELALLISLVIPQVQISIPSHKSRLEELLQKLDAHRRIFPAGVSNEI